MTNMLYHRIQDNFKGNILYPLNELKAVYPDIYEQAAKKYEGRENVPQIKIPYLNCLWNDVLHLSPVHPSQIRAAMKEAGYNPPSSKYFEIDPHLLDPERSIVYLYKLLPKEESHSEKNFTAYDPDDLERYSQLPEATKEYYKETFAKGERPFLYHLCPHVLFKGFIDISNVSIIEVE